MPDWGLEDALPPLPDVAVLLGLLVADPDVPVFPPLAVLLELESPEEAWLDVDDVDVDAPESPPVPECPEVALPWLEPWPDPPVTVEAAAEWDSTACTSRKESAQAAIAMANLASTSLIV